MINVASALAIAWAIVDVVSLILLALVLAAEGAPK